MRHNPTIYWLAATRQFAADPNPAHFTVRDLVFIWLFCASLDAEHNQGFTIVNEDDWNTLCVYLVKHYGTFDAQMQESIDKEMLQWQCPFGIDWSKGLALVVDCYVYNYIKIIEKRGKLGKRTSGFSHKLGETLLTLPP